MIETINDLFLQYAALRDTIDSIRAEIPQLVEAEKTADEIKERIQAYAKEHGETSAFGWEVKLSYRKVWDTKRLELDHPELKIYQNETQIASVKKVKQAGQGLIEFILIMLFVVPMACGFLNAWWIGY